MSKALKIIFTGSLLLNLVLIGIGAGTAYKMRAHFLPPQSVSPEVRQKLMKSMKENRAQMKPLFKEMKQNKEDLKKILTAETFDGEEYQKSINKMLNLKDKIARQRAVSMQKTLADMSVEEREKLSERFLNHMGSGRKHGPKHHRKRGPSER